jgi:hypothetical protein
VECSKYAADWDLLAYLASLTGMADIMALVFRSTRDARTHWHWPLGFGFIPDTSQVHYIPSEVTPILSCLSEAKTDATLLI